MTEQRQDPQRPTEPLPATMKPALKLVAFLAVVVACIAIAAILVDRTIYG
ncbi:MAG: hypothetical protein ACK4SX_04110 [Alcanivoracaceae bacterium]